MIRRNFVQSIKNLVFSRRCPICKKISQENNYICNECYYLLKKKGKIKNIENYYYLYYYNEEIKRLIADFKLENRRGLGKEIAYLIKVPLKNLLLEKKIDVILPVPISKEREKERGAYKSKKQEFFEKASIQPESNEEEEGKTLMEIWNPKYW